MTAKKSTKLTPRQAAAVIGCSVRHVRNLINKGKLKAKKTLTPGWGPGYIYEVSVREAERFRDAPVTRKGFPRGQTRNPPIVEQVYDSTRQLFKE